MECYNKSNYGGCLFMLSKTLENDLIIIILEKEKACDPIRMLDFLTFLEEIKKYPVYLMPIWFQNIQRDESIDRDNSAMNVKR